MEKGIRQAVKEAAIQFAGLLFIWRHINVNWRPTVLDGLIKRKGLRVVNRQLIPGKTSYLVLDTTGRERVRQADRKHKEVIHSHFQQFKTIFVHASIVFYIDTILN